MTINGAFAFSYQALIEFIYYPNDQTTPLWLLVGQRTHAALLAWLTETERINGRDVTIDPATCRIEDAFVICAPPMEEGIIRGIWKTGEKDQQFGFRDLKVIRETPFVSDGLLREAEDYLRSAQQWPGSPSRAANSAINTKNAKERIAAAIKRGEQSQPHSEPSPPDQDSNPGTDRVK